LSSDVDSGALHAGGSTESPHGKMKARARLYQGAMPDVISIPFGSGHSSGGRWSAGMGENLIDSSRVAWIRSRVTRSEKNFCFPKENKEKITPKTSVKVKEGELTIPEFYDTVKSLHQVVDVDYFLPGCPPPTELILNAVNVIAENKLPEKGSVLRLKRAVRPTSALGTIPGNHTDPFVWWAQGIHTFFLLILSKRSIF
jgi:hypothetical protein